MENSVNNSKEQKSSLGEGNDNISPDNDQLGENSEVTPIGKQLMEDEENNPGSSENEGKAAEKPAPDDDAQLDIETVSP